jgi:hypothetical protein
MDLHVRLFNLHVMKKRLKSHHLRVAQRDPLHQADLLKHQHQNFLRKELHKRIKLQELAMTINWSNKTAW